MTATSRGPRKTPRGSLETFHSSLETLHRFSETLRGPPKDRAPSVGTTGLEVEQLTVSEKNYHDSVNTDLKPHSIRSAFAQQWRGRYPFL